MELPLEGTVYCEISGCYEDNLFHQWASPDPPINFTCEAPFSGESPTSSYYNGNSQLNFTMKITNSVIVGVSPNPLIGVTCEGVSHLAVTVLLGKNITY